MQRAGWADREEAAIIDVEPQLAATRPRLNVIIGNGFADRETEADVGGITVLRPSRKGEQARHGESLLKAILQLIESINDTLNGQPDLEADGGQTIFKGVAIRVAQGILAMAAAIWQQEQRPVLRSPGD